MKIGFLRKKYPRFIYESFGIKKAGGDLNINFSFKIEPNIYFEPKVIIRNVPQDFLKRVNEDALNSLVFHLGLMEIPSYWKATCSPEIIVEAGKLNREQIHWWKNLILNGMGEFFYQNKIDFRKPKFLQIKSVYNFRLSGNCRQKELIQYGGVMNNDKILIPIGGGKDSAVTLEILKQQTTDNRQQTTDNGQRMTKTIRCFALNPAASALKIMQIAGCKNPIIVERKIDPKLLELNRRGYLNGHTPFSSYLAFLSVLCAVIFDAKHIALSNERSSNEGNIKYLGKMINHQWSKSFEFENLFRNYVKKYLAEGIEYFSFLRPLYELQIARIFAKYPKYFPAFLSCNEAYKTASGTKSTAKKWCGKCPKCLFVFIILYPFIKEQYLLKIFNKNLLGDRTLAPLMNQLTGKQGLKPFECVGTKKESLIALYLGYKKCSKTHRAKLPLPFLMKYFEKNILPKYPNLESESQKLLHLLGNRHNLSSDFLNILKMFSAR